MKELVEAIEKKYGNLNRFSMIVGKHYSTIYSKLRNESQHEELWQLIEDYDNRPLDNEVGEELRNKIRTEIYRQHWNAKTFAEKFGFTRSWLSLLMNGGHKRISKNVLKVCEILKIEPKNG